MCDLTGIDTPIWDGPSWYNSKYATYGFVKSSVPQAKSLACYKYHVSVVEAVDGDTVTISEGGFSEPAYADYGYCRITTMSRAELESDRGGGFLGYVYLASMVTMSWENDAYISTKAVSNRDPRKFRVNDNPRQYDCAIICQKWKQPFKTEKEKTIMQPVPQNLCGVALIISASESSRSGCDIRFMDA